MLAALRCPVVPSPRRFVVPSSRRSVARRGARSFRYSVVSSVCCAGAAAAPWCGLCALFRRMLRCFVGLAGGDRGLRLFETALTIGCPGCVRGIPGADDPNRCGGYFKPRGPRVSGGRISRKPEEKADAADPIRCLRLLVPRGPQPPGAEARNSLSLRAPSAGCGRHLRSPCAAAAVRSPAEEHVPQAAPRRPDTEIPAAAQCTSFRAAGTDFPRKLSYLCRYL